MPQNNYLVIDDEWNHENGYEGIVGLVFAVPPSYAKVTQTALPADYEDIWEC